MNEIESTLLNHGISLDDIQKAKSYQARVGGSLEKILMNMGSIDEDLLPSIYAQLLSAPMLQSKQIELWRPPENRQELPLEFLRQNGWLLFALLDKCRVQLLTFSPLNWNVLQYLSHEAIDYECIVASEADFNILDLKQSHIETSPSESNVLSDIEEERLREMAGEAPTVNLLNSLMTRALRMNASDIHIEPKANRYRVRFRIDGVLQDIDLLPQSLQLPIISRLKILSGMDISEKRRPQDGKIELRLANIDLDVRVSALPVNQGESMVMRLLRKDSLSYDLSTMGLASDTAVMIKEDLKRTSGVILLTGPTGSGKTSTLYSFLSDINNENVKIVTLEDPVEYQLPGLTQVQVRPEIDFDFSAGLRSIVRQDPDVIMVGEIRDRETCQIAMQAALTGHLVFSTVHTNDAPSAYIRLLDLGVEEFLLNAALISIIAQRLVRKLCEHCAEPASDAKDLEKKYQLNKLGKRFNVLDLRLMQASGCERCAGTGYSGRIAVMEYLRCDDQIRMIKKDDQFLASANKHNREQGRRDLFEDGLLKAMTGVTSIDEILRVCG